MEGADDREAGARVHRRRRRRDAAERSGPPRPAGAVRRAGRAGRLHHRAISRSSTATRCCPAPTEEVIRIRPVLSFRDGKIEKFDKLMAGVRAGETRAGRGPAERRRPERGAPRPEGHGHLRGAGSQEARSARADARVARRVGRLRGRGRAARRDPRPARAGSWSTSSTAAPASRSPRR